jgi:hypothetical protein
VLCLHICGWSLILLVNVIVIFSIIDLGNEIVEKLLPNLLICVFFSLVELLVRNLKPFSNLICRF